MTRAVAILALALLAGCHREVREELDLHAASGVDTAARAKDSAEVRTEEHDTSGRETITVEEYGVEPSKRGPWWPVIPGLGPLRATPEGVSGALPPSSGANTTPGQMPSAQGHNDGPRFHGSTGSILRRRTVTVKEPGTREVVTDARRAASSLTETHATAASDAKATVHTVTSVGPPWWIWLAVGLSGLLVLGIALAATPAGAALLALYHRIRS